MDKDILQIQVSEDTKIIFEFNNGQSLEILLETIKDEVARDYAGAYIENTMIDYLMETAYPITKGSTASCIAFDLIRNYKSPLVRSTLTYVIEEYMEIHCDVGEFLEHKHNDYNPLDTYEDIEYTSVWCQLNDTKVVFL